MGSKWRCKLRTFPDPRGRMLGNWRFLSRPRRVGVTAKRSTQGRPVRASPPRMSNRQETTGAPLNTLDSLTTRCGTESETILESSQRGKLALVPPTLVSRSRARGGASNPRPDGALDHFPAHDNLSDEYKCRDNCS